jgi:hypothetical protein
MERPLTEIRLDEAGATVTLKGALTVGALADLRPRFLDALQHGRRVTVDCAAGTEFDVAFVQFLEAARGLARRLGGRLDLARPVPDGLAAVFAQGGFDSWTTSPAGDAA